MRCLAVAALLMSSVAVTVVPAHAQVPGGDVVMRRPLPVSKGIVSKPDETGSIYVYQLSCQAGKASHECLGVDMAAQSVAPADESLCAAFVPTPEQSAEAAASQGAFSFHQGLQSALAGMNCGGAPEENPPVTPNPTPGPGTPTPSTPDEGPGFTFDPGPGDPPYMGGGDSYSWYIDSWSGDMTCGKPAVLTRQVQCIGNVVVDYDWSDESNPQPVYQTMPVAYEECASYYSQNPPATRYEGTRAACGYHYEEDGWSDWQMPSWLPSPSTQYGTLTCSDYAYRTSKVRCVDATGATAPMQFCEQGLDPNGGYGPGERYEYGNYTGCTPEWRVSEGTPQCAGPEQRVPVRAECVNPANGTVLTGAEATCDPATRPSEESRVVGSCVKKADYRRVDGTGGNCSGRPIAQMHGTANHQGLYWPIWTSEDYRTAKQQCVDSGASCCAFHSENGFARMFQFDGPFSPDEPQYFSFPIDGEVPYPSATPNSLDGYAYAVLEPKWVPEDYEEYVPYPWVR